MKKIITFFIVTMAVIIGVDGIAQSVDYRQMGYEKFISGNYKVAISFFNMANDKTMSTKASRCATLLAEAERYENKRDSANAKSSYEQLKVLNPSHPGIASKISSLASSDTRAKGYIEIPEIGLAVQTSDLGGYLDYENAERLAKQSRLGGFNNWRLPTIGEMQSIAHYMKARGIDIVGGHT